jgi:2-iminobutanoate/2-iminopropanoate deaminase
MSKEDIIMKALTHATIIIFLVLTGLGFAAEDTGATKKIFHLTEKPADLPFSPAILVKDTLYISGQLAIDPETGKFEDGTMALQAERVIKNIEILLKKAGMNLSHVVKTTAFIADFQEFAEFNRVFKKYFPEQPPTRATVQVAKLARDAKIEISAMAVK